MQGAPSLPHRLTPSLPHSLTPSLPHSLTPSPPRSLTPSLPHALTLRAWWWRKRRCTPCASAAHAPPPPQSHPEPSIEGAGSVALPLLRLPSLPKWGVQLPLRGVWCYPQQRQAAARVPLDAAERSGNTPTRGPSWGHPRVVLGTIGSFLEPFCGHFSPKIDKVSYKLTFKYPHEGPCVVARIKQASHSDCGSH